MKVPEADHAYHLARHLASAGLDVHVLTTRRDDIAQLSNVRLSCGDVCLGVAGYSKIGVVPYTGATQ